MEDIVHQAIGGRHPLRIIWKQQRRCFGSDLGNQTLERIAADHNTTKTAVAINWVLRYPVKMQAIVGTTKPERVRESAAACDWEMTREEWCEVYLSAGNKLP